jgi:hypothetical protein
MLQSCGTFTLRHCESSNVGSSAPFASAFKNRQSASNGMTPRALPLGAACVAPPGGGADCESNVALVLITAKKIRNHTLDHVHRIGEGVWGLGIGGFFYPAAVRKSRNKSR